jgi:hypothetical protein
MCPGTTTCAINQALDLQHLSCAIVVPPAAQYSAVQHHATNCGRNAHDCNVGERVGVIVCSASSGVQRRSGE